MNVTILYVGNVYKDYLFLLTEMTMKVLCSIYVAALFISCAMCQRPRAGPGASSRGSSSSGMSGLYPATNNSFSVHRVPLMNKDYERS